MPHYYPHLERIETLLTFLYGPEALPGLMRRLDTLFGRYGFQARRSDTSDSGWSEADTLLITYADGIQEPGHTPLTTLRTALDRHFADCFEHVHLLPFFPWTSDDGFAVSQYRAVDERNGSWGDVDALAKNHSLMFDLVLNHCSAEHRWFRDYTRGVQPYRFWFHEEDPATDLSAVVRPRALPLLTPVYTPSGERYVWTTFSDDQVDLNFGNPDVLFEFLDILLHYISHGARIIRLDAIAYLWKQVGTSCIHLPQTHAVVKLMRAFLDTVAPDVWVLTETNVPHAENVSYFGDGDEAHMVYQFSLPPLTLHALLQEDASTLASWVRTVCDTPPGCTYLNFTASHDGIGVRPLEGLVEPEERDALVAHIEAQGGRVNWKTNADGSRSPYELNCTWFDAVGGADLTDEQQVRRFLISQAVPLALKGIPAVYLHALTASRNWTEGVEQTGHNRTINRYKWPLDELEAELVRPGSLTARTVEAYRQLLQQRRATPAFHPDGAQDVLESDPRLLVFRRTSPCGGQTVIAAFNFSADEVPTTLPAGHDVLSGRAVKEQASLPGYGMVWLQVD